MDVNAVTVGIPVRDLETAIGWYRRAFDLGDPELTPTHGIAEFDLGRFWLQLVADPELAGAKGISLNISVADAAGERRRFADLGLEVGQLHTIEGVVTFFELTDPDLNVIGFVTELV